MRRVPRPASPVLALAACLVALSGCGEDEAEATPAACLAGADAYLEALGAAPGAVVLDGTPLADCLTEEQGAGQIAAVGEAMIAAAKELNEDVRKEPLGEAGVQLGYLVGAVEARAAETGGIHRDLALNVESSATFLPKDELLPAGFQQRYEEGLAAGRDSG
jgi:hypothetical protein